MPILRSDEKSLRECMAMGKAKPYGDYFKKLTRCLAEDYCKHKLQFGKYNLCMEEERSKRDKK